jgi:cellulose synthase/poly-beta-1,6-N-acetylglucosamine synthase-like glycosyltransferase
MEWLSLILFIPYVYLLLKIYSSLHKIRPYTPDIHPRIFISVIVACRDEEKNLPSLLSCLAAQDYPPDSFELIVVDDNSADATWHAASGFDGIKNLKIFRNKGAGKKKAIRTGVEECSGELLVTTDADCRPGKKWLRTIASFYSENLPAMIICPVAMKGSGGFLQRFQEIEFLALQGVTAGTAAAGNPVMCNGANLAFTKEAYIKYSGGLHEEKVSGDDVFLLHGMKEGKGIISWLESTEATVTTAASPGLCSFLLQRARWISKAGAYRDSHTISLAIVTFVTILLLPGLLIAGFFNPVFLLVSLTALILKSVPDYLILRNTSVRYGTRNLMKWFLPSQIFFILYVLVTVPLAIFKGNKWE